MPNAAPPAASPPAPPLPLAAPPAAPPLAPHLPLAAPPAVPPPAARSPLPPPLALPSPVPMVTFDLRALPRPVAPAPQAGPLGLLVIALAYFSLGVAVGALVKQSPRARRWLPVLVVPGLLAALAFVAWVIRTLL